MGIIVITAIIAVIVTLAVSVPVTANLSVKKKTEKDAETKNPGGASLSLRDGKLPYKEHFITKMCRSGADFQADR